MKDTIPVKKNEDYIVNITAVSSDGNGVTNVDGYTLFVPDSVSGDTLKVRVVKVKSGYGYAKVLEVISPSPDRIEPICPVSVQCGGCFFSHIAYPAQLKLKQGFVFDALTRLGGIKDFEFSDIIGMDEPYRYRNKMVFPFGQDKNGEIIFGFYRQRSHDIIPLCDCTLGDKINFDILNTIKKYMEENNIRPYDEISGTGTIRRAFIRKAYHTNEIMVVVCANSKSLPNSEALVEALLALDCNIKSIILNVHRTKTNLILGKRNILLCGKPVIKDFLCGLEYEISPHSFFQVNPIQTEKLYKTAIEMADISKEDTVLDIYCGIGTISLFAAKFAKKVIGVELVAQAIENAKKNALENEIENADFFAADAQELVPELIDGGINPDIVILDPPRKGSDEATLSAISSAKPKRIVYVSCNPATLARDLKFLGEFGYKTQKVTSVDMFPFTTHVECCVLLCRT